MSRVLRSCELNRTSGRRGCGGDGILIFGQAFPVTLRFLSGLLQRMDELPEIGRFLTMRTRIEKLRHGKAIRRKRMTFFFGRGEGSVRGGRTGNPHLNYDRHRKMNDYRHNLKERSGKNDAFANDHGFRQVLRMNDPHRRTTSFRHGFGVILQKRRISFPGAEDFRRKHSGERDLRIPGNYLG